MASDGYKATEARVAALVDRRWERRASAGRGAVRAGPQRGLPGGGQVQDGAPKRLIIEMAINHADHFFSSVAHELGHDVR